MVPELERGEWLGLAALAVGFTLFTFGTLNNLFYGVQSWSLALGVVGALIGFVAAGYLIVYYHVLRVVGR